MSVHGGRADSGVPGSAGRAARKHANEPRGRTAGSRVRRLLRDTALVVAITGALVLLLEVGLRSWFPQHESWTLLSGEHFSLEDPLLGIRYQPGAHVRISHPEYTVEYMISQQGYRDPRDLAEPKPAGSTRVLLLGDSFTFGQGVGFADTWAALAERHLQQAGRSDIQLLNAGVQGMDQRSEILLMERLLPETNSDAVVVVFLINDLYTNRPLQSDSDRRAAADNDVQPFAGTETSPEWEEVRQRVFSPAGFLRSLHLLTLARRIVIASDAMYNQFYLAAPGRGEFLRVPLEAEPRRQLEVTEQLFREMAALADSLGAQFIVLSIPQQFQVLYHDRSQHDQSIDVAFYDEHLSEVVTSAGGTWVSALDAFAAAHRTTSESLFYRLDGHLTKAGNQVVADVFVRDVMPLLECCAPNAAQAYAYADSLENASSADRFGCCWSGVDN